jgi:APA family basic amino acid/polyamine antiporter
MESTQTTQAVDNKKLLGLIELYPIALGTVIGAGIVTIVGPAIAATGFSMWLAYIVAIVIGFIAIFPFVLLSGVVKMQGGFYSFILGMLGEKMAGFFCILYIPNAFTFGLYGIAMGSYVSSIFPFINAKAVGMAVIIIFAVVNIFGVRGMANVQKILSAILISSLAIFIIFGFTKLRINPFDFSAPTFLTNGGTGFRNAVILLSFSTTSYYLTVNFGNSCRNPKKHLPLVLSMVPLFLVVLYGGVGIVASCILPVAEVAGKPLTMVARTILPTPLFFLFIIGGAMMAICTTLNSVLGAFAVMYRQACLDGWLPKAISKMNKYGQPYILLIIAAVIGVLPILLGFSISLITNNVIIINYLTTVIPSIAVFVLPTKYPEAWKESIFGRMPKALFYFVVSLSVVDFITICILSSTAVKPLVVVVTLVAIAISLLVAVYRSNKGLVHTQEKRLAW